MSKVLIVTGMHRSGTSLVANYLDRSGLDMGNELLPADVGNPHGYFEDVVIHDFHRQLLKKAGVPDAFTVPEGAVPIATDETDIDRAREIVASRPPTGQSGQWGWKEPRTALFLDLWDSVLPDASYVLLFRRPDAVLDSLMRRASNDQITDEPVLGLVQWRIYTSEMLRFARRKPASCVWFETDSVAENPGPLIDAVSSRFGFRLQPATIHDVMVDGAYHSAVRLRARMVAKLHPTEWRRCSRLYDELHDIARGATELTDRART